MHPHMFKVAFLLLAIKEKYFMSEGTEVANYTYWF